MTAIVSTMRNVMAVLFALALVGGCKGKQSAGQGSGSAVVAGGGGSAGGSSASGGSGSGGGSDPWAGSGGAAGGGSAGGGSAGSTDGSAAGSAAGSGGGSAAVFVPPKLDEKDGVVFADRQGGKVKDFVDGQAVTVVNVKDMMAGTGDTGEVTVKSKDGGKAVKLAADRVLIEDALNRSPDGKYIVFAPITGCGDFCHSVVWFIASDGRRAKLGDGGPEATVTYSPDGKTAAVGSQGLWLVTLADLKVKAYPGFMSPIYAPDGTLYVRDHTGSAFTVTTGKPKQVWKAPKLEPEDEEMYASEEPRPVQFKDGKPVYDQPWWDGAGGDQ